MDQVFINRTIDSALAVQNQVSGMRDAPLIPKAVEDKHRHVWIVFKNQTQFPIHPDGDAYFCSGGWHGESMDVSAYGVTGFGGVNTAAVQGCTGGARFKMALDDQNSFTFVIGFASPESGRYKAHVEEGDKAEEQGYQKATDIGNTITSKNSYRGHSKNGEPLMFRLNLSAVPGETMTVTISQDVFAAK